MKTLHLLLLGSLALLTSLAAPGARADQEQDLIAVLKSSTATPAAKCEACKDLRIVGTTRSLPALAEALLDERISQAARYAIEEMRTPEAGTVLREALAKTSGPIKIGVIDSLGWRHDTAAVALLAPLLSDGDGAIAAVTASALGRIGGKEATATLLAAKATVPDKNVLVESLLRCAEQHLAANEPGEAETLYNSLVVPTEDEATRIAAYTGLIRCTKDGGVSRIKAALEGGDPVAQTAAWGAAANLLRNRQSTNASATARESAGYNRELTKTFAALVPNATPPMQMALLSLLQQAGDPAVQSAVLLCARNATPEVQAAAMNALGEIGHASAVPLVTEFAVSSDAGVRAAARKALATLNRGDVAAAMIATLRTANERQQVEVVRALSTRAETAAVPALLKLARSEKATTQAAAFNALGNLAAPSQMGELVQLLRDVKSSEARAGMRVIFETMLERAGDKANWDFEPMAEAMASGDVQMRQALLPISALFINQELREGMRAALKDGDERIRASAARALCEVRDPALLPDLLTLVGEASDTSLRSLALERIVRVLIAENANIDLQRRADMLSTAMSLATRAQDKRMVLSGVAQTPHPTMLALAEKSGADGAVRAEAELASLHIAQKLGAKDMAARNALSRLAADATMASVRAEAQAALNKAK